MAQEPSWMPFRKGNALGSWLWDQGRGSPSRPPWPHHTGVATSRLCHLRWVLLGLVLNMNGITGHSLWCMSSSAQCHVCGTHPRFCVAVVPPFCCCREYSIVRIHHSLFILLLISICAVSIFRIMNNPGRGG